MIELGKKNEIFGAERLKPLGFSQLQTWNRPVVFPLLAAGHKVIAGYDQGLGERMIVCDSLEEMQEVYDNYAKGGALRLQWYAGPDPGFVMVMAPSGQAN